MNWHGVKAIYRFEMARMRRTLMQSVASPVLSTSLYFVVFGAAIGASFTVAALVTGSLWGRPMWGTYWEWDARLTSVLILFLMYLGIMALWRAVEDPSRAARAATRSACAADNPNEATCTNSVASPRRRARNTTAPPSASTTR